MKLAKKKNNIIQTSLVPPGQTQLNMLRTIYRVQRATGKKQIKVRQRPLISSMPRAKTITKGN